MELEEEKRRARLQLEGLKKSIEEQIARGEKPLYSIGLYRTKLEKYKKQFNLE